MKDLGQHTIDFNTETLDIGPVTFGEDESVLWVEVKQVAPVEPWPFSFGLLYFESSDGRTLGTSKPMDTDLARPTDSDLDALHWSGQGVSSSTPVTTTSVGSRRKIPRRGRWRSVLRQDLIPLVVMSLALALAPLLGSLLTLLALSSITPSPKASPESSYPPPSYGRRPAYRD